MIEGTEFMDQVALSKYFGTGVVVSTPKEKWEVITPEDLENATPAIREGDIVIVNTGRHRHYGDNREYFLESPGTYKEAGEWARGPRRSRASASTARRSTTRGRPKMGRMAHICRDTPDRMVLRSRFWLGGGSGLPPEALRQAISEDVGLGLMRHAHTEFKSLSRFLPSLYIADRRETEPVELPWWRPPVPSHGGRPVRARRGQRPQRKEDQMTDHTGRIPGADHLPGKKGLEEEIRDANKDDPVLSQEPPDADDVDEAELTRDREDTA